MRSPSFAHAACYPIRSDTGSSATFHFTFSVSLHFRSTFFSSQNPCPLGPRQLGQSAACIVELNVVNNTSKVIILYMALPAFFLLPVFEPLVGAPVMFRAGAESVGVNKGAWAAAFGRELVPA